MEKFKDYIEVPKETNGSNELDEAISKRKVAINISDNFVTVFVDKQKRMRFHLKYFMGMHAVKFGSEVQKKLDGLFL